MFARADGRMMALPGDRRGEDGSGTVLAFAIAAAGVLGVTASLLVSVGLQQLGAVRQAADQVALGAADVARGLVAGATCEAAGQLAVRNGVDLERCDPGEADVRIEVSGTVLGIPIVVDSRAGEPR